MIKTDYVDLDRFDRMKRIEWIDMDAIHKAKCLVVGAGALGNEVVKNLVLAGFRDIVLVDMDHIVLSNLSRCLFFRESDVKKVMKADIVAERASELDPEAKIVPKVMNIEDMEEWNFDVVLGCLDNIAARMHVNSHSYYYGIPYVDGATDGMNGKVQVVLPGGPCLQCPMNLSHMKNIERRFSCTGNGYAFVPKMASDITTTAAVAAMQVREAMKIVSGKKDLCIKNVSYYDGVTGETSVYEVCLNPNCPNHLE